MAIKGIATQYLYVCYSCTISWVYIYMLGIYTSNENGPILLLQREYYLGVLKQWIGNAKESLESLQGKFTQRIKNSKWCKKIW